MPRTFSDEVNEKFDKLTKNNKTMFLLAKPPTREMEDGDKGLKTYNNYKRDKKTGLPMKYEDDDFVKLVDTDILILTKAVYVIEQLGKSVAMGKAGVDHPLAFAKSGIQLAYEGGAIDISRHTAGRIRKYIEERLKDHVKIYYTRPKKITVPKPKEPSLRIFDKEWATFFRKAATERLLGTKSGEEASADTKESDLLFPSTEKLQKKNMPYLFGYSKQFPDCCVVKAGFMQSFIHYFLNINNCKNESKKDYVRVEVDGKTRKIANPTYRIPDVMKDTLKKHLKELETKSNALAKENEKEAKENGTEQTKQYYESAHVSNLLLFSLVQVNKTTRAVDAKKTLDDMKVSDKEARTDIINAVVDEESVVRDTFDTATKARQKVAEQKRKEEPRKSNRKIRSKKEERDELLENDNRD